MRKGNKYFGRMPIKSFSLTKSFSRFKIQFSVKCEMKQDVKAKWYIFFEEKRNKFLEFKKQQQKCFWTSASKWRTILRCAITGKIRSLLKYFFETFFLYFLSFWGVDVLLLTLISKVSFSKTKSIFRRCWDILQTKFKAWIWL